MTIALTVKVGGEDPKKLGLNRLKGSVRGACCTSVRWFFRGLQLNCGLCCDLCLRAAASTLQFSQIYLFFSSFHCAIFPYDSSQVVVIDASLCHFWRITNCYCCLLFLIGLLFVEFHHVYHIQLTIIHLNSYQFQKRFGKYNDILGNPVCCYLWTRYVP